MLTPRTLLYAADPMCSWCWGFAPVLRTAEEHFAGRLGLSVVLGGLRPGTTRPLSREEKVEIRTHWEHVQEMTGQPFDFSFFDRDGFVYDTEPGCRAVVAARRLDPERALLYLEAAQAAFYRDGRDITDRETLIDLAAECGFERQPFAEAFDSEAVVAETHGDFVRSRQLGVRGFPSLLACATPGCDPPECAPMSMGYRPWRQIERDVESWMRAVP